MRGEVATLGRYVEFEVDPSLVLNNFYLICNVVEGRRMGWMQRYDEAKGLTYPQKRVDRCATCHSRTKAQECEVKVLWNLSEGGVGNECQSCQTFTAVLVFLEKMERGDLLSVLPCYGIWKHEAIARLHTVDK